MTAGLGQHGAPFHRETGMKQIVAIDDEPIMLRCLEKALEHEGYKLFVTSEPDEGIEFVRTHDDIRLLMLDIKMPKKSGFQIYTEVRAFRKLPVLFITAYPKSFNAHSDEIVDMWQKEFSDGTTDIIYKPFDLQTLFDKVEGLIGKAQD
ncbi:MAG: hypothetical protein A2340_15370 [Lentisphaerae bacterium RIFOXYB12_FULL_60_10]|nr:MAG: hypothetical protein A2269_00845 [Lentisphaerae bacterium RIFOXYA12_FULL_60_10]OGV85736.1 MAG: hypothetical protein A2340_15370 [Lentisphaerae bacterium RIFOXYB12_FULL_60_10]